MDGWQPIETAPDDGRFLVFGCWDDEIGKPAVYLPDYTYRDDERVRFVRDGGPMESDYGTATHWMPIPPAPTLLSVKDDR